MFLYLMFLFICIIQTAYFTSLWIPMQLFALTQWKIDKSAPKCWQYSINYDDNNNKLLERNLNESQHVLILGSTILLPLGPAARFIEQTQTKPLDRPERSFVSIFLVENARNDRERRGDNAIGSIVDRAQWKGDDDWGGDGDGDGDDLVVPSWMEVCFSLISRGFP